MIVSINIAGDDLLIRGRLDPVPEMTQADTALLGRHHSLEDSIALIQQVSACGRIAWTEMLWLLWAGCFAIHGCSIVDV